jgi:uncharacterized protein
MKRIPWIAAALLTAASIVLAQTPAQTPAKRDLVAKVLQLQQPGIEAMAREIAEQPVRQLTQQASAVLQKVPVDKREAIARRIDADMRKYVEEVTPLIRERAVRLAPSTVGLLLEQRFSEDELRQLIAWMESPVNKKYQQLAPEMQNSMIKKLLAEVEPVVEPKRQALQQEMRKAFGLPATPASAPASAARPAARPASR